MKLQDIKTNKCPICGCDTVVGEYVDFNEYEIKVHTNGSRWEHRRFLCGIEICFDPNFDKEYTKGECKNNPEYLKMLQKQEDDKKRLVEFCETNDIDKNIIRRIHNYVL